MRNSCACKGVEKLVRRPVPPIVNASCAYFYTGLVQQFPFQITSCGHFVVGEGFYTERDKREDYQLIHTLEGAGYLIVDGVRRELPAGSYVMIDCSRYHYYAVNGERWVYDYVHLAGDGMKAYLDNVFTLPLLFFPSEDTMLNSYMSTVLSTHIQDDNVGYSQACALCASILNEIVKACARSERVSAETGERGKRDIESALLFMRCHYMEAITLDDLVRETYMTKYHFCHRFKQITGMSPYQFLVRVRIENARNLLLNCDDTLYTIAEQCGFGDTSTFIRQFKRITGQTPGELRTQHRKWIGEE